MPNWCNVSYKCIGDSNEIKELHEILERMNNRKEPVQPNGFGNLWLGELVLELGFDWEKYRCRGEITSYSYDGEGLLTISQYTAWCEQKGVRRAIEERFPSVKVYWIAEEPGCDVYCTNDFGRDFFPERYLLDGEDIYEYFESVEDVSEYVNSRYGLTTTPDSEEIQRQIAEYVEGCEDDGFFLNIHEFKYVED